MLILGHRGYHAQVPENTIAAFEAALSIGLHGIETDVCLTVDRLPVLFHDRVTPDGHEISSITRSELEHSVGHSVPSLNDLESLILRSDPQLLWNLEIKQPDACDATVEFVQRLRKKARFLITSFWHPVIKRVARETDIDCGLLVCHHPFSSFTREEVLGIGSRIETIVWSFERVDASLISESARVGVRNFVYGAITPQDHAKLVAWAVDGIITDHPQYILPRSV